MRGESAQRGGHGVGLAIVRRLSDRFGWPVHIESQQGVGTRVEITFPSGSHPPKRHGDCLAVDAASGIAAQESDDFRDFARLQHEVTPGGTGVLSD